MFSLGGLNLTVYKYFIKTAIRYKWIIISYTMIFFLLSLINSSSVKDEELSFTEKSFNIGLVDKSNSDLSRELTEYLDKKNTISQIEDSSDDYIKEQIFMEVVDAVILIPEDFDNRLKNKKESIEIFRDERKMESIKIENDINKFLVFTNATLVDDEFNIEKVKKALEQEAEIEVLGGKSNLKNSGVNTWFKYYFNFSGYVIIAIYVSVICLVMTELNGKNTRDRIKVSSKKLICFNAEIYMGQVTMGIFITSIFVLASFILKGKYLSEGNVLKYMVNIYVFSFAILCFTFLVTSLTTNKFAINGISTLASLGTAFISGILVPQEFLSEKVLGIAKFFPTYYFVRINETNISSFLDIRYEILMQLLFAITFLVVGLYFSKIKQKI